MSQYTAELHVQHCSVLHPLMFDVQVQWCMLYCIQPSTLNLWLTFMFETGDVNLSRKPDRFFSRCACKHSFYIIYHFCSQIVCGSACPMWCDVQLVCLYQNDDMISWLGWGDDVVVNDLFITSHCTLVLSVIWADHKNKIST